MENQVIGWGSAPLANLLVHVIGGDWGKAPEFDDNEFVSVVCVRGSEFKLWNSDFGSTAVHRKIKSKSLDTRKLITGDILIEISGGGPEQPVGRTVLIDERALSEFSYPAVCTNFIRLARPADCIDSSYLNYYLTKFYFSGEVVNYQAGSNNLRNLKFKAYETISIPLPPLAEQKQIADTLDRLLAQVASSKAELEAALVCLKQFRQSVLAAAVSGELTKDWRGVTKFSTKMGLLGDFVSIDIGHAFKSKEFTENGVRLLRGQNIEPTALKWSETKYFPADKLKELNHLYIKEGDIILAMDRPIVSTGLKLARAKKLDLPCVLVQRVTRFRKSEHVSADYLYLLLSDLGFLNYIQPNQTGSDIPHISGKQILSYPVSLPSPTEQTEIVSRVESLFAAADKTEAETQAALDKVNNLTQSILAKAFSGDLTADWRVQTLRDNPELLTGENSAANLLVKIKAEREAKLLAEKEAKKAARAAAKKKA